MADPYEYVRNSYGVPAKVGARVRMVEKSGVIVSARSNLHYIHVRFDGKNFSVPVHPTDVNYYSEAN